MIDRMGGGYSCALYNLPERALVIPSHGKLPLDIESFKFTLNGGMLLQKIGVE